MNSRILVADDQIANCELLAEILTAEGFDVITAGDGAEALNQFAETPS
jgi:CheY-like chemotaxis protein